MITQDQAMKMAMQKSIIRCDGQYLADDEQITAFANACAEIGARESQSRIDALESELRVAQDLFVQCGGRLAKAARKEREGGERCPECGVMDCRGECIHSDMDFNN